MSPDKGGAEGSLVEGGRCLKDNLPRVVGVKVEENKKDTYEDH
jgi:hypothetical protein